MENQTHLGLLLGFGIFAMISLSLLISTFYNFSKKKILERDVKMQLLEQEKQFAMFKSAKEAEEILKEKLAKKIHNTIIPIVTSTQRSIDKNINDYEKNSKIDLIKIKNDMAYLDMIIDDLRSVSHDLMPSSLASMGLLKAIEYYMEQINDTGNTLADFENLTKFKETLPLSKSDQRGVYEIFLEVINNLFKHANYKYLKVTLDCVDDRLQIEFMHNGIGITNKEVDFYIQSNVGLGLKSLKASVLFLKASIDYIVESDTSSIILSLPLNHE